MTSRHRSRKLLQSLQRIMFAKGAEICPDLEINGLPGTNDLPFRQVLSLKVQIAYGKFLE